MRRDVRRAAAFLWMMPRLAVLLMRAWASCTRWMALSFTPSAMAARLFLMAVLMALFADLLRSWRFAERRTSFFDDLIFGMGVFLCIVLAAV